MNRALLASLLLLASCASTTAQQPAETTMVFSPGVAWVLEGKGWAEEAEAVFADATDYIQAEAETRVPKSWAVVLDLDETVINNVQYQAERETLGESYTSESWYDWIQREEATLVPGVADFLAAVNTAGDTMVVPGARRGVIAQIDRHKTDTRFHQTTRQQRLLTP